MATWAHTTAALKDFVSKEQEWTNFRFAAELSQSL
jgi:hypothetical protein